jgi:hypothetical protein
MTLADATSVHQALTNNDFVVDTYGNFYFSCAVNAELDFVLNGGSFNIGPQDYMLPPVPNFPNGSALPSNWCLGSIQGHDGLTPPWTLGAGFIRNVRVYSNY